MDHSVPVLIIIEIGSGPFACSLDTLWGGFASMAWVCPCGERTAELCGRKLNMKAVLSTHLVVERQVCSFLTLLSLALPRLREFLREPRPSS